MTQIVERNVSPTPKVVGLVVNPRKPKAVEDSEHALAFLKSREISVKHPQPTPERLHAPIDESSLEGSELLVVMGGDGTLLAASRFAAPRGVPMLSIRYGGFGFLAEAEPEELEWALDRVLTGAYRLDRRMMLASELCRRGDMIHQSFALNDVSVTRGALSRIADVRTETGGGYVATYSADGVIVSTPTGSTAYNLSAGGPLVHPGVRVLTITPICPHSLNARSLVLSDAERVTLTLESLDEAMLTADGQVGYPLEQGDVVHITRATLTADLVTLRSSTFYDRLQNRLRWADRFAD
ncbi:MAG: NAD(+)/NADH kinase [Armatimonadetes bacterium]|nr:NAD(+)/NADH kinase [Armatimonadota bacterium]